MSLEVMKQALEALEQVKPLYTKQHAIAALRQAIEQASSVSSIQSDKTSDAEKQEHHAKDCALLQIPSKDCDCSQKQEPVAWMDGYRNIYSLEEKAAGCEDAVIPLVPAIQHWSDCAVHNEPAYPKGDCDCGGYTTPPAAQRECEGCDKMAKP